ncbi:MAG TPA: PucR family transcriptional regulator ligand-binding domain-containing protein [Pseudonocardiaceae bacterium]|jgi:purine catabolism regulator|nr:PucR family transcriptional regulator ligand-binding domain-containing protein [Pseudonocardiaceae bacterium]
MTEPITVADVLALPVLAAGQPKVVTGQSQLGRVVGWVHITELTDPATFLKGGELVLTTGMPLPTEPSRIRRYVDELAAVGAAGLVIELVRRYHRAPDELVRACRARDLPLVTLSKDVNFLEVTQVVHALILGNQTEAIRRTQQIHDRFTALTLRGAGPEEVVRAAAQLVGAPVVLENLVHQAVICAPAGLSTEEVLTGWEQRSRLTPPPDWLVAPVEYRGERWGRVVMLPLSERPFGPEEVTVLDRTAMALTITRLTHPTSWEREAHRSLLLDLAEQRYRSPAEARARIEALGVPATHTRFVATLVDLGESASAPVEDRLAHDLASTGTPALVGQLAAGQIGILLALGHTMSWQPTVQRLSTVVLDVEPDALVCVGSEVDDLVDIARSFREASRVAEAALPGKPFHQLSDIGLRELLYALREDVRIQDYVERRLGRLIDYDARHNADLVDTLHHYLDAAGNKTVAARRGDLSRQTLYQRLRTIERLLDCDLESGEQRTTLHVALTALDVMRRG